MTNISTIQRESSDKILTPPQPPETAAGIADHRTAEVGNGRVVFPERIKHRGRVYATIYDRTKAFPAYRLAWRVCGKRRLERFPTYEKAKARADELARDLAAGSIVSALLPRQAADAMAALERLEEHFKTTGVRLSLLGAIDAFLGAVGSVKRKDVSEAAEEFLKGRAPLTKAAAGHRAELCGKYAYNRAIQLRRFAAALPGVTLCDLTKDQVDAFMALDSMAAMSPKSKNHYRGAILQFLKWAVRQDYLSRNHRLGESAGLRMEHGDANDVSIYTPEELGLLMAAADIPLLPLTAIGALAGLRTAELLRLDWADVWRVPGHIEITSAKSKTRQRRLVEICPALAAWLEPWRATVTGPLWPGAEITFHQHVKDLCARAGVPRKANGLRHSFCSYHFALHSNEHLTAAQAGNSPAMLFRHYRGLATKEQAERWFATAKAQIPQ